MEFKSIRIYLNTYCEFSIGNGITNIWAPSRLDGRRLGDFAPYIHIGDTETCFRDIISNGAWNLEGLITPLQPAIRSHILSRRRIWIHENLDDRWRWKGADSGCYTTKSGYDWLINSNDMDTSRWAWIWRMKVQEKIKVFIWLYCRNSLPTNKLRFDRKMASTPTCA